MSRRSPKRKGRLKQQKPQKTSNGGTWASFEICPGLVIKVDREDLAKVCSERWYFRRDHSGRIKIWLSHRVNGSNRHLSLGRFLRPTKKGLRVFKANSEDQLDFRKSQLIIGELKAQQRMLPKRTTPTTSRYKGVSFTKGKWRAAIQVDGVSINLGDYSSENEAAIAYNKSAKRYFGRLCYLNKILLVPKKK